MSMTPTKLIEVATKSDIDAELHDDLEWGSFFDAEEVWAPERVRFLRECVSAGVPPDQIPQSIHWNWSLKALQIPGHKLNALSPVRLFGIRTKDQWQGLLLAWAVGHLTRLDPKGRDLVYVDFVENAPWNWSLPQAKRVPRYAGGIGSQLMELAIQWSRDMDFRGRVGLHALPQAEGFYRDHCGMTEFGPDLAYKGLHYFEFSEEQATSYLGETQS